MVLVGAIAGGFGVKGEVRLKSFTSEPEDIASYGPLFTEDGRQSFQVRLSGRLKNALSARLSGISSKEQADRMKGMKLFVPREAFPQLPDDEFYHADLIGLSVYDTGGGEIGAVKAVLNHGATDLLELRLTASNETALLPFTRDYVPTVDMVARKLIIDPPNGLIE